MKKQLLVKLICIVAFINCSGNDDGDCLEMIAFEVIPEPDPSLDVGFTYSFQDMLVAIGTWSGTFPGDSTVPEANIDMVIELKESTGDGDYICDYEYWSCDQDLSLDVCDIGAAKSIYVIVSVTSDIGKLEVAETAWSIGKSGYHLQCNDIGDIEASFGGSSDIGSKCGCLYMWFQMGERDLTEEEKAEILDGGDDDALFIYLEFSWTEDGKLFMRYSPYEGGEWKEVA